MTALRILLLGNTGQLGWELERALAPFGKVKAVDYPDVDMRDEAGLRRLVRGGADPAGGEGTKKGRAGFQLIVNAAAYTAVDRAEGERETAMAVNARAPGVLAEEAGELGAALIHFSTDYVFDGAKHSPYVETDGPRPLGVYGRSKLAGEEAVARARARGAGGAYLILRTAWVYSVRRESFVTKVMRWADAAETGAAAGATLAIVDDQVSNPTWARALAEATARLLRRTAVDAAGVGDAEGATGRRSGGSRAAKGARVAKDAPLGGEGFSDWLRARSGLYHLAGDGFASRFEWAREILRLRAATAGTAAGTAAGADPMRRGGVELIRAKSADFRSPAERPQFSALDCGKFEAAFGFRLPPWRESLRRAFAEDWRPGSTSGLKNRL